MNNEIIKKDGVKEEIKYINGWKVIVRTPIRTEEEEQEYLDKLATKLYYIFNSK